MIDTSNETVEQLAKSADLLALHASEPGHDSAVARTLRQLLVERDEARALAGHLASHM